MKKIAIKIGSNKKRMLSVLIGLAFISLFPFIFYISNINYFGEIRINLNNDEFSQIELTANSPFGNNLHFTHNQRSIFYEHKRFYKDITIDFTTVKKNNAQIEIQYSGGKKTVNLTDLENKTNLVEIISDDYRLKSKLSDLFKFYYFQLSIITVCLLILLFISSFALYYKNITVFFVNLSLLAYQKRFVTCFLWVGLLLSLSLFTGKIGTEDKLVSDIYPDQIEYHTCAVNQLNGYGFLIGGKIDNEIDYKIAFSDEQALLQHKLMAGVSRLDRFPAYSYTLFIIYNLFGVSPGTVKILQLGLLLLFVFFIPLLIKGLWDNQRSFWGGLIASGLLFFYLLKYTQIITPDLFTVFINFFIVYLYIKLRKNLKINHLLLFAFISGLSFLFKASMVIFLIPAFLDIVILIIKQKQDILKRILLSSFLFLMTWVPYNIYSIKTTAIYKQTADKIIQEIKNKNTDDDGFNHFIHKQKDIFKFIGSFNYSKQKLIELLNYDINEQTLIEAFYNDKRYFEEIKLLYYLNIIKKVPKIYFIISLYDETTSALDLHNEFSNDGLVHKEWKNKSESFYNNDGYENKSDIFRMLNFYTKNPGYIISIPHYKLNSYFQYNIFVRIFTILVFLYIANSLFLTKYSKQNCKNRNSKLIMTIGSLLILFIIILSNSHTVAYLLAFAIKLSATNIKLKEYLSIPILFAFINLYAFPVLGYGNERYMIYYDTFLFILIGILITELLFLHKSRIKKNTAAKND